MEWKQKHLILLDFLIPVVILMALTIVFWITDLDIAIQRLFFVQGKGWIYKDLNPWRFLYDYGTIPAIVLAVASLFAFIGSFWIRKIAPYRRAFLFFVLLMIIGPGLVVNTIFKGYWGRPRPRNVEAFGGSQPFLYVWEKGKAGEGHSFPCGHASMVFFLFSPYFIFRKRSEKWSVIFLTVGLSAGIIIGLARMVQGGHFASDVIWSGGFVYLSGIGLYYLLCLDRVIFEWRRPDQVF
jgi:lipid A 4'-phosphatase